MALVQRPLAAILAQPASRTPRDLEGKRVGVTGLPSDDAVLRSIVAGAGGDPGAVRPTTIGFTAVREPAGASASPAATAFWNAEGVALRARRPDVREFRVDDFGAPVYPELVLTVTRATLQDDPGARARDGRGAARAATARRSSIPSAASAPCSPARTASIARRRGASSTPCSPPSPPAPGAFGELSRDRLRAWARWEAALRDHASASPTWRARSTGATRAADGRD